MNRPDISIICPVYNEKDYIEELIAKLLSFKPEKKEIIFIDGGSTDGTLDILKHAEALTPEIRLLINSRKIVPFALNLAIPECKSGIISRIDAHTEYAPDYFVKILEAFDNIEADVIGGPTRTKAKNDTQQAVAHAICTKFAIGGSRVHQLDYRGYTDSVTFGAWRSEMFRATGLFDTSLKRNQDDEFHYRAKSLGFRIYQDPDIKLWYYPRDSFRGLFNQYFQYGLYKPLVLKKIRSEVKLRHLIPSLFVLYLAALPLSFLSVWFLAPLVSYVSLSVYFSIKSNLTFKQKCLLTVVYPTIHMSYGTGFILGLFKKK